VTDGVFPEILGQKLCTETEICIISLISTSQKTRTQFDRQATLVDPTGFHLLRHTHTPSQQYTDGTQVIRRLSEEANDRQQIESCPTVIRVAEAPVAVTTDERRRPASPCPAQ